MSLKLSELRIDNKSLGEQMLFASASEYFDYVDGRKNSLPSGTRIEVILPEHGLEKLAVKIKGASSVPEIQALTPIHFANLVVKAYSTDRGVGFTATADSFSAEVRK